MTEPSMAEIGEFLMSELFAGCEEAKLCLLFGHLSELSTRWDWSGLIIERMRERGFVLNGDETYWAFREISNDLQNAMEVRDLLSPRTIALAAYKALKGASE